MEHVLSIAFMRLGLLLHFCQVFNRFACATIKRTLVEIPAFVGRKS